MDDDELTRLAIAEIVREMGELKDPPLQERKINPIAKPNKRFLGRTINSMMSHNKREDDRTQENCRKKLRELDERKFSRDRSSSRELVLSSSTNEDNRRDSKKLRKRRKKTISKKHKKGKKRKYKSRKRKLNRRESSSSSSESSSSRSTSGSSNRSRRSRSLKISRHKNPLIAEEEQTNYENDMNAALELDAALIAVSYRQHQIQQLMFYSALMAGNEAAEINALQEELQMSDIDFTEPQVDNKSISSAVSSFNLEDGDTESSEILQISLSSASSTSSKVGGRKKLRRKREKEKECPKQIESTVSDNEDILELDSASSVASDRVKEVTQVENYSCICIDSETENGTETDIDEQSDSDSLNSEAENQRENMTNDIRLAAVDIVTLLSSSDSEVEIVTSNDAKVTVQEVYDTDVALISTCQMEITEEERPKATPNLAITLKEIVAIESLTPLENGTAVTLISASPERPTVSCIEQNQQTVIMPQKETLAEVNSIAIGSRIINSIESMQVSNATGKSDLSLGETKEISEISNQSAAVRDDTSCELVPEETVVEKFKPYPPTSSPMSTNMADVSNAVVMETITHEEADTTNSSSLSTSFLIKNDFIITPESCTLVSSMSSKSESPPASTLLLINDQSQIGNKAEALPRLVPTTVIVTESNSVKIQNENNSTINLPVLHHPDNGVLPDNALE